jgi:hypothetical protein
MKIITSLADIPLPMPDGRVLSARGKLLVPDHIAAGERVRSWGANVLVEDYVPPAAEEAPAESEAPKGGKGKAAEKAPEGEKA